MKTYIYGLQDPNTQEIRYVGKSNKPKNRYHQHIFSARKLMNKTKRDAWITSLLKKNQMPILVILEEITDGNWQLREQYYIAKYSNLTNHTIGGDDPPSNTGVENPFYGKTHTEETKKRLSEAGKQRWKDGNLHLPPVISGSKNHFAKLRIFISPEGIRHEVYSFKKFCKDNDISDSKCFEYINRGPIPHETDPIIKSRQRRKSINSVGWEIIDGIDKYPYCEK